MILGLVTLLTALCISGIAAYYSIVGLTAIFAAAVTPIILMGAVLEVGKVVTTLWLHYNWDRATWKIRSYLVSAVGILMLITSMGIFGFLSKAHLEQAVPSGDVQAQVLLFDEKIKTQRDNIESNRKALAQMDASVDQMMSRTTDETGAQKSANLRSSQKKERARLFTEIDDSQKLINKLQEERAPAASKLRKVEAEVGPIKYIAALIYGDQADQNMLEAAVRWVIIIIVLVFDPLAIILLLAATTSIDWSKLDRRKKVDDSLQTQIEELRKEADASLIELKAKHAEDMEIVAKEARANVEAELMPIVEAERQRVLEIQVIVEQQQQLVKDNSEHMDTQNARFVDLDKAVRSMADDLDSARDQLTEMEDEREASGERIIELVDALTILDSELTLKREAITDLTDKCNALQEHDEQLSAQLRELAQQYEALVAVKAELDAALANEKNISSELAGTVEERNAEIERLMAELALRMADIEQLLLDLEEARKPLPVIEEPAIVDLPKIEEEQPLSGTLTDPEVAKKAFEAVMHDRPEYFEPKVEEQVVEVSEIIEDIPSNEELLKIAAETKDEFYKTTFAVIEQMSKDFVPTVEAVVIEPTPEPIPEPAPVAASFAASLVEEAQAVPAMPVRPANPVPLKAVTPKLSVVPDNFPMGGNASFGTAFPTSPIKGDLFLRVDYMPSKLFKWVGTRWIEMDKALTDTYAYDQEYVKLLIDKVNTGEYDIDDLSDMEQEQIAEYLSKH